MKDLNLPDNCQGNNPDFPWNQDDLTCNGCGNGNVHVEGDAMYCDDCEYVEYPPEEYDGDY